MVASNSDDFWRRVSDAANKTPSSLSTDMKGALISLLLIGFTAEQKFSSSSGYGIPILRELCSSYLFLSRLAMSRLM
jgi:hypothetical protein